ncbi:UPF0147 family protein [Candidatus Woesearchaeota archaeon]|nr:UPF0147 family protein [Candidatus Woesearchaeota archaeon]
MDPLANIIFALSELGDDTSTPKNIKAKLENVLKFLNASEFEMSVRVSKALGELDEISQDSNVQPYMRAQLFNIVSLLESF